MPIYEYACESCDHEFEKLVRAGSSEPDACPDCDSSEIERLISNTNFQLKGSGWYETDYARADEPDEPNGEPEAHEADGESGGEAETSEETTAETDVA